VVGSILPFIQAWLATRWSRVAGERGQGAVEYAVIVAVVAVAVAALAPSTITAVLNAAYGAMSTVVTTAVSGIGA
jgi:Flp pilus assembly pilin Flp